MNVYKTVDALLASQLTPAQLQEENILTLKAIGWQLASRYKFSKDKEDKKFKYLTRR